jgi:hypothetical protein
MRTNLKASVSKRRKTAQIAARDAAGPGSRN